MTALPLWAESSVSQVSFVRTLYQQQRYFDCIGEAYRLKSFLPPARHGDINYFILGNYFLGRQYFSVIQRVSSTGSVPEVRSALLLSRSFISLGDYRNSLSILKGIDSTKSRGTLSRDVFAAEVTTLLHMDKFKEAMGEVKGFRGDAISRSDMAELEKRMGAYRLISRRSPWLGAVMSGIIPGSGQFYSGRYLDALLSIVSVAAPLTGGIFLYREGKRELAGTLFSFLPYSTVEISTGPGTQLSFITGVPSGPSGSLWKENFPPMIR